MTRRTENSGLIDLDALMREAGTRDTGESPPTPVVEAASSATKVVDPPPIAPKLEAPPSRPALVQPPPSRPALELAPPPPPTSAPAIAPAIARAEVPPAPKSGVVAKDIPQPPSKTNVTDDSLEAVSCEPRTDPWIATASSSSKARMPSEPPPPRAEQARPHARAGHRKGIAIGLALALVAGGVVFLRPRATVDGPQTATAPTTALPSPVDAPKAAAAPPPAESPTVAALSADDLPPAAAPSASTHAPSRGASSTPPQGRAADPSKPTVLTEASLAPSSAEHGDLGSAMRGAVGANDKVAAVTTEGPSGPSASQLHPSQGALVGAIGAVLPTARACLGPDDTVRNGLVVFKSDGTVARVEIRGSKPEDDCVRDALSKAKVAPFVDDSFSTRVTVRP